MSSHAHPEAMQPILNESRQRFEIYLGTEYAYIDYRWYDGRIALMHTFVPTDLRGKGVAATLAAFTLQYIREKSWKAKVYCPYLLSYLKRHPEYQSVVDAGQ